MKSWILELSKAKYKQNKIIYNKKIKGKIFMNYIEATKSTTEWKALNTIWKNCSTDQRTTLYSEFEVIADFILKNTPSYKYSIANSNYHYLNALSKEAKDFVIFLVNKGEKNIYHSFMAVLNNKPNATKEEILTFYFRKYSDTRPYLEENRSLVCEVLDLCWNRIHHQKG